MLPLEDPCEGCLVHVMCEDMCPKVIEFYKNRVRKRRKSEVEAATTPLDNQSIFNILEVAKKSLSKFNEKFDWTRTDTTSGYTPDQTPAVPQENVIPESNVGQQNTQQKSKLEQTQQQAQAPTFNFEDINF